MAQNVKTVCGVAIADVKTLAGVAIANVKTIVGVDNTSGGSLEWNYNIATAAIDSENNSFANAPAIQPILAGKTGNCEKVSVFLRNYNFPFTAKFQLYVLNGSDYDLLATKTLAGVTSANNTDYEITLDTPIAVTSAGNYAVGMVFSDAGTNANAGFQDLQPANSAYMNFGSSYAAAPLDPYTTSGNGLPWKFRVGMGIV